MEITEFLGTCSSQEIGEFAEKKGRKFSYKKAVKMIRSYDPEIYDGLALNLHNPWDHETNIKTVDSVQYLHIVHSAVDYIFKLAS